MQTGQGLAKIAALPPPKRKALGSNPDGCARQTPRFGKQIGAFFHFAERTGDSKAARFYVIQLYARLRSRYTPTTEKTMSINQHTRED